jgi:hypothetical protein
MDQKQKTYNPIPMEEGESLSASNTLIGAYENLERLSLNLNELKNKSEVLNKKFDRTEHHIKDDDRGQEKIDFEDREHYDLIALFNLVSDKIARNIIEIKLNINRIIDKID